jgi:hypothetical protein
MPYWLVRIMWAGYKRPLILAFTNPPTRQDIKSLLEAQWRVDESADESWEFLLIADFIPEYAFEGKITTIYGTITCHQKWMHNNGQN